jgi:hypothetical protein
MMACQYRGVLQVNCAGWTDYTDAQNVAGKNTLYHGDTDWLADKKWHYYTAVFEGENAKVFIDGELKNEWDNTKEAERTQKGLFSNGAELKYVCLGGNQAWDWNDNDAPFDFARLLIKNSSMSANEIKTQMAADFPGYADYLADDAIKGDVNSDSEVNVGDLVSVSNFMAGEGGTVTLKDADVNEDGEVNVGDLVTISNIMAGTAEE